MFRTARFQTISPLFVFLLPLLFAGAWTENDSSSVLPEKCGFPGVVRAERQYRIEHPETVDNPFLREERQKTRLSGHFRIHYDTTGTDAAAMLDTQHLPIAGSSDQFADSVASVANSVWTAEIETLGYLGPPTDGGDGGGPEYDIYVRDLNRIYGSTFPETPLDPGAEGSRYTSYIEIDNDFIFVNPPVNRGLPALRVTLAHEFFHAIQLGGYGLWSQHVYLYEISSVWMEDLLFTDVNDYLQYLLSSESQFSKPEIPFTNSGLIMYSRAIWGHFIAKRFGQDTMRRMWELTHERMVPPLEALDIALEQKSPSTNLNDAFAEWSVWNYFTAARSDTSYYPEGASYPLISQTTVSLSTTPDTINSGLPPLSSLYHAVSSGGTELTLITANTDLEKALAMQSTEEPFSYILRYDQPDPTYVPTIAGVYLKRETGDPFVLATWIVINGLVSAIGDSLPTITDIGPFPNPFVADGFAVISIPVNVPSTTEVDFYVFSADMDLVYSARFTPRSQRGHQVLQWNGRRAAGELAQSGIYFYYADIPGGPVKGKFALIRGGG